MIVMSTNLEYKERERLRKRERRRQVSEAHREKSVRELEQEIKNKGDSFRKKNNMKILAAAGRK